MKKISIEIFSYLIILIFHLSFINISILIEFFGTNYEKQKKRWLVLSIVFSLKFVYFFEVSQTPKKLSMSLISEDARQNFLLHPNKKSLVQQC